MAGIRRFLWILGWMFWQGGFLFYASVVVPIGTEYLGSALEQGMITRQVTWWMNLAGLLSIGLVLWDLGVTQDSGRLRRKICWFLIAIILMGQMGLFWLHSRLDSQMDLENHGIVQRPFFKILHRTYLWTCTVQWGAGLLLLYLTLLAWQAQDQQIPTTNQPSRS